MTDPVMPERVTDRVITSASNSGRIEIGTADLQHASLSRGDEVKVLAFEDRIVIRPES